MYKSTPLAAACLFRTRERLSVQSRNTFLRVTGSSQLVPRGEWRWVFLRVSRNEVMMARTQSTEGVQSWSENTSTWMCMETHTYAWAHVRKTLNIAEEGLWLFWCFPQIAQAVSDWRLRVYLSLSLVCLTLVLPCTEIYHCCTLKKISARNVVVITKTRR